MTSPILFIVFNRPNTTRQVFEEIRRARPTRLYVAADGPRSGRDEEVNRCAEVRNIATQIDWPCTVKTLFRDKNLGCGRAVSSAIDWFFENEPEGIILEDDCLPHPSFFQFCDELLDRYRNDDTVMSISGSCFARPLSTRASYGFLYYSDMWGWASWRRAWRLYDFQMNDWHTSKKKLNELFDDVNIIQYWCRFFDMSAAGKVDTWDYQWIWTVMQANGLCVAPYRNMIMNLGFNSDATHTTDRDWAMQYRALEGAKFPLKHPKIKSRAYAVETQVEQTRLRAYRLNSFSTLSKLRLYITDIQCYRGMMKIIPSAKKLKELLA